MSLNRRIFITGTIAFPALAGIAAAARADSSKASQDSMHYQTTPHGSAHCATCKFFIPAADASANGTCKIVDGSISPNGYCIAYTSSS
jgi:hypothetical protein